MAERPNDLRSLLASLETGLADWRGLLGGLAIGLAVVLPVWIWADPDFFWLRRQQNHQALAALHSALIPGMSPQQVSETLARPAFARLALLHLPNGRWVVQTPLEFGATNWVLWIDFLDGRVGSIRVRIADTEAVRPTEAPPDKALTAIGSK